MFGLSVLTLRLTSEAVTPPLARRPHARYIDCRGSHAMSWCERLMTSKKRRSIARCCTLALCGALLATRGDIAGTRKCMRGKGTIFIVMSFMSTLSGPSKRMPLVRWRSALAASVFMRSYGFLSTRKRRAVSPRQMTRRRAASTGDAVLSHRSCTQKRQLRACAGEVDGDATAAITLELGVHGRHDVKQRAVADGQHGAGVVDELAEREHRIVRRRHHVVVLGREQRRREAEDVGVRVLRRTRGLVLSCDAWSSASHDANRRHQARSYPT